MDDLILHTRKRLLPWVVSGDPFLVRFQRFFQVPADGQSWTLLGRLIFAVFRFGASFGDEPFFIAFLPWLFWEYHPGLARRVMYQNFTTYYVGQMAKDVLKLPRPTRKFGVQPLERHYAAEYGMPSTHAMSGLSIPFALLLDSLRHLPEGQSATPLVVAAVAWFSTCTLSRLYMGVHSPADVIVGLVLGLILLALHHFVIVDLVDSVVLHASPWAAVGMVLFVIALSALYPRPKKWVNSVGDTVLMISSVLGTSLGAHVLREEHIAVMSTPLTVPTIYSVLHSFPRLLIGFGLALTTRAIVKFLFVKLLVLILGHKYVSVSGLSLAERRRLADKSHASGQGVPEKKASDDGDEEDVPEDTPIEQAWAAEKKAFFERVEAQWLASKTKKTDDDDHGSNDGPKASTTGSSKTSTAAPTPMTKSPSEESLGSPMEATSPIPDMMRIEPSKRYEIELPTKIAVYTVVGFVTVCIVPSVFKLLNL